MNSIVKIPSSAATANAPLQALFIATSLYLDGGNALQRLACISPSRGTFLGTGLWGVTQVIPQASGKAGAYPQTFIVTIATSFSVPKVNSEGVQAGGFIAKNLDIFLEVGPPTIAQVSYPAAIVQQNSGAGIPIAKSATLTTYITNGVTYGQLNVVTQSAQ